MLLSKKLEQKLKDLIDFLKNKNVIVAFSGGVDSSLLAFLSNKYALKSIAISIKTIFITNQEMEEAKNFANKHDIPFKILRLDSLENEEIAKNPINRCYLCKLSLYDHLISFMNEKNFDIVIDGTNIDDMGDFRPGFKALQELGISTPYIDFNITKKEIRELSKYFGLKTYSKPSMACLASRIPYGEKITEEVIERVSKAENFLRSQFSFSQLRVRVHNNNLARIEILPEEFNKILEIESIQTITKKLKELGFVYITFDLEGFRSGSMNEPFKNTSSKH
jgi:uncharacterized protein